MKKLLKKFLATRKFKERSRGKYNCTFHSLHQEESKTWRSINKEIRTVWVSNFVQPNLHTCVSEFAVKLRIADVIDKKIVIQCLTCWKRLSKLLFDRETVKWRRNATNFFVCVLCSRHARNMKVSFHWIINYKSIWPSPFFSFSIGCISWYWVGQLDWKKKKLKKSQEVSQ